MPTLIPELSRFVQSGMLTLDEATEANSYAVDLQTWLTMPVPLMNKVFSAAVLETFDPQEMGETKH